MSIVTAAVVVTVIGLLGAAILVVADVYKRQTQCSSL